MKEEFLNDRTHNRGSKETQYLMVQEKVQDKKTITPNVNEPVLFFLNYFTGVCQDIRYFSFSTVLNCWLISSPAKK